MLAIRCPLSALALVGVVLLVSAGESRPLDELQPRPVRLPASDLTLQQALKAVQEQSGNTIDDLRSNKDDPKLTLRSKTGSFWQMLDALGKEHRIGFSAYQANGGVALVDAPYRELKTSYSGLFRFAVKRIAVSKDEETQAHHCHVTLDTAWEPRFKALYLNLDKATAVVGAHTQKMENDAARPVAGASATEIELRMNAPDRKAAKIDTLKGAIRVVGAPKMLEFKFTELTDGQKAEQEGVVVRLTGIKRTAPYWNFDLQTVYPEGAIVELGSYQSWRENNRVWLEWTDAKTKRTYELEPIGQEPLASKEGTSIRHVFAVREKVALPPKGANVVLRYRTPNRVVAFTVPFAFQDLPLP